MITPKTCKQLYNSSQDAQDTKDMQITHKPHAKHFSMIEYNSLHQGLGGLRQLCFIELQ